MNFKLTFTLSLTLLIAVAYTQTSVNIGGAITDKTTSSYIALNNDSKLIDGVTSIDEPSKESMLARKLSFFHSKSAINELRVYFADHVRYPEIMLANMIEGQMILEVAIDRSKNVSDINIFKSIHPQFDKAVERVISDVHHVTLSGDRYYGNSIIYVPLQFSITDL